MINWFYKKTGEFLKDAVYAANDGIITTFAVVASVVGASLEPLIILILGFANLFADGISMASGNYLGTKSEKEMNEKEGIFEKDDGKAVKGAIVTLVSFMVAGLIPIIPYIFLTTSPNAFLYASIFTGLALFGVGAARSVYMNRSWISAGLEMFLVGGFAAVTAYGIGYLVSQIIS